MGLGTLLIRADASPEIGTGHVMRCLALAQAWQDAGGLVLFAMAQCTSAIQDRLRQESCEPVLASVTPGSDRDIAFTRDLVQRNHAEWLVLDSYKFSSEYQQLVMGEDWGLLCVDDEGKCEPYVADIVLNQNVNADQSWYARRLPETQLLLGTSFCLLRREFALWREWKREIPAVAQNVLVTLGGSTPEGMASLVIESLSAIAIKDMNITFVIGGSTANMESIENLIVRFPGKISVRKNAFDMPQLLSEADVALSAAGSTCWELCLMGLPSVLLDLTCNQSPVAQELEQRQCALYGGNGENISASELAKTMQKLLHSHELREHLSTHSRQLVDGWGAQRIVSAMQHTRRHPKLVVAGASH